MTTISQTAGQELRPSSRSGLFKGGFFRFIANGATALLDYLERRAAIKTLSQLDDRALRDIGITRSQIDDAVDGTVNSELMRLL